MLLQLRQHRFKVGSLGRGDFLRNDRAPPPPKIAPILAAVRSAASSAGRAILDARADLPRVKLTSIDQTRFRREGFI